MSVYYELLILKIYGFVEKLIIKWDQTVSCSMRIPSVVDNNVLHHVNKN